MKRSTSPEASRGTSRVRHLRLDVLVGRECQVAEQARLRDQHEIVTFREVVEQQPQPPEVVQLDEMRVVDDGCEHLARVVDSTGLLDEAFIAADGAI